MIHRRTFLILLFAVAIFGGSSFAAIKRVGGKPKQSTEDKMIENIRDAVDGLRDSLADQTATIRAKMEPILRQVNGQAEAYIAAIRAYAEARDAYYLEFDNTQPGEESDEEKESRQEMDSKRRTMNAERNQYYQDTARYLRTFHQVRRAERRQPQR